MRAAPPNAIDPGELARFEAGEFDVAGFTHREHVRIGHALLSCYSFPEAAFRFSVGLRTMARKGGKANLYHETITIAFLSLIAERNAAGFADFSAFERSNPDLFSKSVLSPYYSPQRLNAPTARATFLLPDCPCR
jgi:hypothetical protein